MTSLRAARRTPGLSPERAVIYAVAAVGLALSGKLVVAIADVDPLVPTQILAVAGSAALLAHGVRTRTLTSPMILLGVPLLLSLAAATLPITRIYSDWTTTEMMVAVALVLAPLVGVWLAVVSTDGRVPTLERGTEAKPRAFLLVTVCTLMTAAGTVVYLLEWQTVGGPPLLSPDIDEARFAVEFGPLHVITQGIPLSFLVAAWARVARPRSFTALQRRMLEALMIVTPFILILGGGRALLAPPLISAPVVVARYLTPVAMRRLAIWLSLAVLLLSSAIFITRVGQHVSQGPSQAVLYNSGTGERTNPLEAGYRALSVGLGEQLRVILELREDKASSPPFTTTLWFAHYFLPRAIDPHTITQAHAGGWLTSMYAGQVLLDFGLVAAILFGVALGAVAHLLYRHFAKGRSIMVIWLYAYLASPIVLSFYVNVFLYFIFPIIDVIWLYVLSRVLLRPAPRAEAVPTRSPALAPA